MHRRLLFHLGFLCLIAATPWGTSAALGGAPGPPPTRRVNATADFVRRVLTEYCVTCHNQKLRTAGLMLDALDHANVGASAESWEKVARKLRAGSMPPVGLPRPEKPTYERVASWLESALDAAAAAAPEPGRPAPHRLNRAEYANAVRDLLEVEVDSRRLLPGDDSGYGFDNIADVLSVSPALLERYLSAAREISRVAVGDPSLPPFVETYGVPKFLRQGDRVSEELPFGSRGGIAIRHNFPLDGEYELRIRLQRSLHDVVRGLAEPNQLEVRLDRARITRFTVGGGGPRSPAETIASTEYERTADAGLQVRFPAKAGLRVVGIAFVQDGKIPDDVLRPPLSLSSFVFSRERNFDMGVDSVQISGPYDARAPEETPSRRRIFTCRPRTVVGEEPCAKAILSKLARRAYRRPVTDLDVQPLIELFRMGRSEAGFDAGVQAALEGLLVDPEFLFRAERDPVGGTAGRPSFIGDLPLASRLSFFLWSSIPDDGLLDIAARGRLREPATLRHQVRRMLADSRSSALVSNFGGQWLHLRNMRRVAPDPETFPEFDDSLREAFQRETELFLESVLREDRSVLDLLSANYTFANERLARHYGIPNVYGSHFRRVTLSGDARQGLLGQGSILTVTSYPNRTSPVLRGKWVLENLLGAPPPPPPPNVPNLPERGEDGRPRSVRDRLEQHRKNPACATCHAQMDPLGFALENFDGVGKWRTTSESGAVIDASGVLPNGAKFVGPKDLRSALLDAREGFVRTLTEKLLTYAIGRGLEYYDMPVVRRIVRDAARDDYRWSSLVLGIVESTPFQMRRSGS